MLLRKRCIHKNFRAISFPLAFAHPLPCILGQGAGVTVETAGRPDLFPIVSPPLSPSEDPAFKIQPRAKYQDIADLKTRTLPLKKSSVALPTRRADISFIFSNFQTVSALQSGKQPFIGALQPTLPYFPLQSTPQGVAAKTGAFFVYSTVTDLARFRGLSMSHPFMDAT